MYVQEKRKAVEFLTNPIAWWIEPFTENVFMQNLLWVSLLTVISTSLVGTWVVVNGLSFFSDALAHGVLPGIVLAVIFGFNPSLGAMLAAIVMVAGMSVVRNNSSLPNDTSIGLLFVGFLALAVVLISSPMGSNIGDLNRFLFGSISGVSSADIWQQAIVAVITVLSVTLLYRAFAAAAFDEVQAALLGLRPKIANAILLFLLAVVIVSSFETVGNLLVFAFLIAPPATASIFAKTVPMIMVFAVGFGVFAVIVGSLVSYHYDTAPSATVALVAVVMFMLVLTVDSLGKTSSKVRLS